jgi:hypothetical protein
LADSYFDSSTPQTKSLKREGIAIGSVEISACRQQSRHVELRATKQYPSALRSGVPLYTSGFSPARLAVSLNG